MRPQKVLDIEILTGLAKVFRSKGYEGASLKELSEATGLKKASLYHRFPNGKQEMANAVLNHVGTWVEENIFQTLLDESLSPETRLKKGLSEISILYNGGSDTCLFRALSMQAGIELFEEQIKNGINEWITTFKKLGTALNFTPKEAETKALQVLIQIQGSLIIAKAVGEISIFKTTLTNIEETYLLS